MCIIITSCGYAQTKAVTDKGDEVFLYDNGTWKYIKEQRTVPIATNPTVFSRNTTADFLLKSTRFNVGFWLNPEKWTFKKGEATEASEYRLQFKGGDLYGQIVTEKLQISLKALKEIALTNTRKVAPDVVVTKQEYRTVNGLNVLHLEFSGTVQDIKFSYFSYYFSNVNGTVQYLVYSSDKLLQANIADCQELLNGLVEVK